MLNFDIYLTLKTHCTINSSVSQLNFDVVPTLTRCCSPNNVLTSFYSLTMSFGSMLFNQRNKKHFFGTILFVGPTIKLTKQRVSLSNFYTSNVDVGPTLTIRSAPNAKYKLWWHTSAITCQIMMLT